MTGRIWPPSFSHTAGGKCDQRSGLFGNPPGPSTRNTNPAARQESSNPAVLWPEPGGGQRKTGAVPSRNPTEFAPGSTFSKLAAQST